ncbi:MAG TPA: glutathione S-transferase N-terminal domain-containing protein [Brevundimonas sp.]
MKLYISTPSPFARKCRIVALERGVAVTEVVADPYADDPALLAANPIVQVPTLIAMDGQPVSDSPVICEYLDGLGSGPRLLPADGPDRLRVKRIETLGNALLDQGVKRVLELRRPESERSPSWMARWTAGMQRTLDVLEASNLQPDPLDMGVITVGVALTWISFRHPDIDWKSGRPNLVALQGALEQRPSFVETAPR